MKKILFLTIVFITLLASCTTTRKIKVDDLEDDVFVINKVVLTSNTIRPTDEELVTIFQSLPYLKVCDLVEEKTDIVLDSYLIDYENISENIEYTYLCDAETDEVLEELPEWELNLQADEETTQFCTLYFTMDPPDGFLAVKALMHTTQVIPSEKEDKEDKIINLQTSVSGTFETWTFKRIFVDPRSCALIKFHKNIEPTFIQNELFSAYKVLNGQDKGYLAVNIREPIEIRCNINDPGNIFFSPAEIYNASFTEVFQPGKSYYIKYKLKRVSPDSTNWVVKFKIKEEKPNLSK